MPEIPRSQAAQTCHTPGVVLGVDVSAHQRSISWKAIAAAGIEFGFVKATEGTGYVNSHYEPHRKAARRRGIPVGAYHFARPDFDEGPEAEADHFLEVAAPRAGDLLPALDLERFGSTRRETARWARRWLRRVEKRIGEPPILYTYSSFAQGLAGHEGGSRGSRSGSRTTARTTAAPTACPRSASGRPSPCTSTRPRVASPATTGRSTSTG